MIAMLECLREMLKREDIQNVGFIPGTTNLADGLTKRTTGNDIHVLLTENKCLMISGEEKQKKLRRKAADKQYLFMEESEKQKNKK